MIKEKFENCLPLEMKIEPSQSPGDEPIEIDHLKMIVNQYKQTVLPNKRYHFEPEITVTDKRGKGGRLNFRKPDTLKVFVEGPNSEKRNIYAISSELEQFI